MKEYASFFEWHDKPRKELGVLEDMLNSLNRTSGANYHSPQIHRPDPPDCICLNALGGHVAVEISELVCQEAARLTAQGEHVMRMWLPGELRKQIVQLLGEKDEKTFHGGPYAEIVVCLFTDEPMLGIGHVISELAASSFGPFRQLSSAFLVLSHDPNAKSCPALRLNVL